MKNALPGYIAVLCIWTACFSPEPVMAVTMEQMKTAVTKRGDDTSKLVGAAASSKTNSAELETSLQDYYREVAEYCGSQMNKYQALLHKYQLKQAGINAGGGFVTLLGGVATHPAVKAVLMGLGISSTGSSTVTTGVSNLYGAQVTADEKAIAAMRTQYQTHVKEYEAKDATSDPTGRVRFNALLGAYAACAGLEGAGSES